MSLLITKHRCQALFTLANCLIEVCGKNESNIARNLLALIFEVQSLRNDFIRNHSKSGSDLDLRYKTIHQLEGAILISLCSQDMDIGAIALDFLRELCDEIQFVDGALGEDLTPAVVTGSIADKATKISFQNFAAYRNFLDSRGSSGLATGKVAHQKRIRRLIRSLVEPSEGAVLAWEECYRLWSSVNQSIPKTEESFFDVSYNNYVKAAFLNRHMRNSESKSRESVWYLPSHRKFSVTVLRSQQNLHKSR